MTNGVWVWQGHLQFLMSEMNTANPRIPSPFDTAGMFAEFFLHAGFNNETNDFQMFRGAGLTGKYTELAG